MYTLIWARVRTYINTQVPTPAYTNTLTEHARIITAAILDTTMLSRFIVTAVVELMYLV